MVHLLNSKTRWWFQLSLKITTPPLAIFSGCSTTSSLSLRRFVYNIFNAMYIYNNISCTTLGMKPVEKVLNASKRWVISVLIHRHSQMWGALASSTAAAAFGVPSAHWGGSFLFQNVSKTFFFFEDGDISIMIPLLAVPLSSVIASLLSKMMMIVIIMRRRRRRNSFSSCCPDSGHQSLDMS